MKTKLFPFVSAIIFTLICAANIFSQGKLINIDETRPRVVENSETQANVNSFDLEKKAFALINDIRRLKGLKELLWSDEVANIARKHSQSMANNKFFSHRGLDGLMINDRADTVGLTKWRLIGENIAYNRGYPQATEFAVECWMKSAGHRENLLNPRWKETGIGVGIAADGAYYFTQVFLLRK